MNEIVHEVAEFHRRLGFPVGEGPTPRILARRLALIDEEAQEVRSAIEEAQRAAEGSAEATEALRHVVQELVDLTYVIAGTFVELGIDPQPAWQAVHAANMRKSAPPDGGKAVKPADWLAPIVPVVPLVLDDEVAGLERARSA
jgi:predicted HAD superfamily Cof-like phosphohydrolase